MIRTINGHFDSSLYARVAGLITRTGSHDRAQRGAALIRRQAQTAEGPSTTDGRREGFELACELRTRWLVSDLGRALRLEHRYALTPAGLRQCEAILNQNFARHKRTITLVDRDRVLVVEREMANAIGHTGINRRPGVTVDDRVDLASLQSSMEGRCGAVSRRSKRARRAGISARVEHRTEGQDDAPVETGNRRPRSKTPPRRVCGPRLLPSGLPPRSRTERQSGVARRIPPHAASASCRPPILTSSPRSSARRMRTYSYTYDHFNGRCPIVRRPVKPDPIAIATRAAPAIATSVAIAAAFTIGWRRLGTSTPGPRNQSA